MILRGPKLDEIVGKLLNDRNGRKQLLLPQVVAASKSIWMVRVSYRILNLGGNKQDGSRISVRAH